MLKVVPLAPETLLSEMRKVAQPALSILRATKPPRRFETHRQNSALSNQARDVIH